MKWFLIIFFVLVLIAVIYAIIVINTKQKVVIPNISKGDCKSIPGSVFTPTKSGEQVGGLIGGVATGITAIFLPVVVPFIGTGAQLGGTVGGLFQKGTCTFYKNK